MKILRNFVAFSEYMNFKYATQILFLTYLYTTDSWHNHPMLNSYVGVALMRCLSCQNKYVTLTEKLQIRKYVLCTLKLSNYNGRFWEGGQFWLYQFSPKLPIHFIVYNLPWDIIHYVNLCCHSFNVSIFLITLNDVSSH